MTRKALLLVTAALLAALTTASPGTVALGQTTDEDVSYTGSAMDSFGAKFEAVAGLAFDPHFAYAQSVVFEQTPLATAHAYVAFPGTLIASTMITCCGASADYPRFGGRLPSETICGDPGNDKESVPEIRDPRNYDPNAPNPVTGQKPSPAPPLTTRTARLVVRDVMFEVEETQSIAKTLTNGGGSQRVLVVPTAMPLRR